MRRHSVAGLVRSGPGSRANGSSKDKDATATTKKMVVAVRVRPLSQKERDNGHRNTCQVIDNSVVAITKEGDPMGYLRSQLSSISEYAFDHSFDSKCTQQDVYEQTTKRFIPNLLKGLNVTVFAYGATGAGKTHTIMGNTRVDDSSALTADAGIIPQAVHDLFSQINGLKKDLQIGEVWKVNATFVEIYNEQVYDLNSSVPSKVLKLNEDPEKGIVAVAGVNSIIVNSAEEVISLLLAGNKNRKTEATMANSVSSRSHAILQLFVAHTTRTESGREVLVESRLSIIDLAGSERASATNNRGARLQEGANINKSLLALANCINALATNAGSSGKRMNVKYRDSRLTHLLKSSLEGGNCNLVMIANINPSHVTYEDSHNTLKYANRAKNIKVNPIATAASVESNWMEREKNLRQENKVLRDRVSELEILVQNMKDNGNQLGSLHREIQDATPVPAAIQYFSETKESDVKMPFETKYPENGAKEILMEEEEAAPRQIANVLGYMSGAGNKRRSSMREEIAPKSAAQEKTSSSKNRRSSDRKSRRKSFDPDDLSHRQYQKQHRHSGSKRTLDEDDVGLYANKKKKSSSNNVNPFENLLESAVKSSSRANREDSKDAILHESSSMKKRGGRDKLPQVKDDIESSLTPHMSGSRASGKHRSGSRSSSVLPDILPDFEYSDEPTITPAAMPASSKKRRSAPVLAASDDTNIASAPTSSMPTRVNSRRHSLGSRNAIATAAQENRNPNLYPLPLSMGKEGDENVVRKSNVSRRISMANVKNLLDNLEQSTSNKS